MDLIYNLVLPNAIGDWFWFRISRSIPISEVYKYPEETWNRYGLSQNKDISIDLIHNLVLPHARGDWRWYYISSNIPISEVYKYPDETWIIYEQGYIYGYDT